ncbi:response regulator [Bradyrhizobium sp. STM 3557]|uniref:response regulator n=1 Tax=Bradyrhizobium sp. STM 3557 TaxID=578920 RepID=UPI00388D4160
MQVSEPSQVPYPHTRPRILCVEDDAEIAQMMGEILEENGFAASFVGSAADMDSELHRGEFALVVLDVMLPDEDGLSICRRLRRQSSIPIIVVTARAETVDRVVGLELGADDYVTKPFNSRELIARIRALLRRAASEPSLRRQRSRPLTFAGWRIDPTTRELHDPTGLKIALTSVEFDLLLALCCHAGEVLSREQLMEIVHGGSAGSVERSIDVHISRIRQKIEPDPRERSMIKTVRLGGYLFTPTVEQA